MLRARRNHLYGVGPRSAHIAGLPYSCFEPPDRLAGAVAEVISPCPGDTHEYVVLRLRDGGLAAITLTCAANLLGCALGAFRTLGSFLARFALKLLGAAFGFELLVVEDLAGNLLDLAAYFFSDTFGTLSGSAHKCLSFPVSRAACRGHRMQT
jgi:hypothetical protein